MGIFDDIFEGIDDITAPEEREPERDKLTVSEAEVKTGMWNAQDDGNVWTADNGPEKWTTENSNDSWNSQPTPSMPDNIGESTGDDWAREDEVLEDFVDEDEAYDGGGMFDDIF